MQYFSKVYMLELHDCISLKYIHLVIPILLQPYHELCNEDWNSSIEMQISLQHLDYDYEIVNCNI